MRLVGWKRSLSVTFVVVDISFVCVYFYPCFHVYFVDSSAFHHVNVKRIYICFQVTKRRYLYLFRLYMSSGEREREGAAAGVDRVCL